MSIPPTISHWLASAMQRTGTRTISPGRGGKEDTAEIVTLSTRVAFQPDTTAGRIFAKRSVLMDSQPGIISNFSLSVFHTTATLKTVVLKLNIADMLENGIPLVHRERVRLRHHSVQHLQGDDLVEGDCKGMLTTAPEACTGVVTPSMEE